MPCPCVSCALDLEAGEALFVARHPDRPLNDPEAFYQAVNPTTRSNFGPRASAWLFGPQHRAQITSMALEEVQPRSR